MILLCNKIYRLQESEMLARQHEAVIEELQKKLKEIEQLANDQEV